MKLIRAFLIVYTIFFLNFSQTYASVCENINQYRLKSGQKVIIVPQKNNPSVVVESFVNTGSKNENETNSGVAHFLEHLFFKGTTNHKRGEFEKILETKGGVFNAATSKDYTYYYVKIADKYLDDAIKLHSDMLLNIAIPPEELKTERKVVLEEISRAKDDPSQKVFENFQSIVYQDSRYVRPVLGSSDVIANISRDEIFNFYNKYYTPSNMTTVIVGNVDTEETLKKVAAAFACAKKRPSTLTTPKPQKTIQAKHSILEKTDTKSMYMVHGYNTKNAVKNKKESYTLDILGMILGGSGESSKLYQSLKEKQNIVQDISAGNFALKDDGFFYVFSVYDPKNKDIVLEKVNQEVAKIKKEGITPEELQKVKNIYKREFIYSNEKNDETAFILGYSETVGTGVREYCDYLAVVDSITADDVKNAANRYLDDKNTFLSIVAPNDYVEVSNKTTAKPTSTVKAQLLENYNGVKKYKLENGAVVLLNKYDSNDIVALKIYLKGGILTEQNSGVSDILAASVAKSTKNRTNMQLNNDMENIGSYLDVNASKEFFEISMKTTSEDFDKAFDILSDVIENPLFEEKYIVDIKKDTLDNIKTARDEPKNIAFEEFNSTIFANSKLLYTGKLLEKTVPSITRKEVIDVYKTTFDPSNMIISVAGDFDENDVLTKFSTLKHNRGFVAVDPNKLKIKAPVISSNKTVKTAKDSKAAWLVLGWLTDGFSNEKDYAALKVISGYLGSGFTSKLFVNLREEKGLAYELASSFSAGYNTGLFMMYIGTNPSNLKEVKADFFKEINDLKTKPISQKELEDTKTKIIGRYMLAQETAENKAFLNGYWENFDKTYKFKDDYVKLIQSVSVQDIMNVADKYFSKPYVMSVVGEEKFVKNIDKE